MQKQANETGTTLNFTESAADDAAVLFAELLEEYPYEEPKKGDIRQGVVLWVGSDSVLMDVGAKRDAIVPRQDLSRLDDEVVSDITVGDSLPVLVLRTAERDDELVVSIKRGLEDQCWNAAETALEEETVLDLPVVGQNKGGLLVEFEELRGFIPSSHVPALRYLREEERNAHKDELIGQTLPVLIIEVNRKRRRLVMSPRAATKKLRAARMDELDAGQVVEGFVESIADFGVFVNIDGITGLAHISKLDWQRVEHPSELFEVGDKIKVRVDSVDRDRGRISLNRRAVMPSPWELLPTKHSVGEILEGVVTNVVDFGIFVQIPLGIEGLVHNSELQPQQADAPFYAPATGDTVNVRILRIEPERQRLSLSMRQIEPTWQVAEDADAGVDEDPDADDTVADDTVADDTIADDLEAVIEATG